MRLTHPTKDQDVEYRPEPVFAYARPPKPARLDNCLSFDTETDPISNRLLTVQMAGSTDPEDLQPAAELWECPEQLEEQMGWVLDRIFEFVQSVWGEDGCRAIKNGSHRGQRYSRLPMYQLWGFNWHFDLVRMFGPERVRELGREKIASMQLQAGRWQVKISSLIYTRRVVFGDIAIQDGDAGIKLVMRDAAAYFVGESLGSAAKSLRSPFAKLERPDFETASREELRPYALQDARTTWWLGTRCVLMNQQMGISSLGSAKPTIGSCSSAVVRSSLKDGDYLLTARLSEAQFAINCLRGGYTGTLVRGTFAGCFTDFKSLYPWAMAEAVPNFNMAAAEWTDRLQPDLDGYYHIRARFKDPHYPCYLHPIGRTGRLVPVYAPSGFEAWLTSYELRSGLYWGDIEELEVLRGLVIRPVFSQDFRNPLRATIERLYGMKQSEDRAEAEGRQRSLVRRDAAKRILNAIQGKTLESYEDWRVLPEDDGFRLEVPAVWTDSAIRQFREWARQAYLEDGLSGVGQLQEQVYRLGGPFRVVGIDADYLLAGVMFNPLLAGMITGAARAREHDLIHILRAEYWDTDSAATELREQEAKNALFKWSPYERWPAIQLESGQEGLGELVFERCPQRGGGCGRVLDGAAITVDKVKRYEVVCSSCGHLAKGEYHGVRVKGKNGPPAFSAIRQGQSYRYSKLIMNGVRTRKAGLGLMPPELVGRLELHDFEVKASQDSRLELLQGDGLEAFHRGQWRDIEAVLAE